MKFNLPCLSNQRSTDPWGMWLCSQLATQNKSTFQTHQQVQSWTHNYVSQIKSCIHRNLICTELPKFFRVPVFVMNTPWMDFPDGSGGKESAFKDPGSIPGLERSPGEGNGYPLQYSCLENSMDRGAAWWAIVHGSQRARHDWVTHTFTITTSLD